MLKPVKFAAIALFFLSLYANALPLLDLTASNLCIGLSATAPLRASKSTSNSANFSTSGHFGIFVAYEFELFIEPFFETTLVSENNSVVSSAGGVLGIRFVYDKWGVIYPYLALQTGAKWRLKSPDKPIIPLQMPFGVIIALNQNFAIDLGLPLGVNFSLENGFDSFDLFTDHIGIKAFF